MRKIYELLTQWQFLRRAALTPQAAACIRMAMLAGVLRSSGQWTANRRSRR